MSYGKGEDGAKRGTGGGLTGLLPIRKKKATLFAYHPREREEKGYSVNSTKDSPGKTYRVNTNPK